MKFKRTLGLVLAVLMVMSSFSTFAFAAENTLFTNKSTTIEYGTPVIDGEYDAENWDKAETLYFETDRQNASAAADKLAVSYTYADPAKKHWAKALWDEENLYVYFHVYDDSINCSSEIQSWNRDGVEIYLDEWNDKGAKTADCRRFVYFSINPDKTTSAKNDALGDYEVVIKDGYYVVEATVPFMDRNPVKDSVIGFDLSINMNDTGENTRDHCLAWNDLTNMAYASPMYMGNATLVGENAPTMVLPGDQALPEGATELYSGWVKNKALAETNIKWQIYTEAGSEDQILKFTYWPQETSRVDDTTLHSVNLSKENSYTGYLTGDKSAWGAYEANIKKVIIGEGITTIAGGVIEGFPEVTTVEITKDLTKLTNQYCFGSCAKLSTIYIKGTTPVEGLVDVSCITSMTGDRYFDCSKMIKAVKLSDDLTGSIGTETFKQNGISEITIPAGVTAIAAKVFNGCSALKKITVLGMETTLTETTLPNTNVVIAAYNDSAAHAFAVANDYTFESLDPEPVVIGGRELPADATLITEGWVPSAVTEGEPNETQIKWQAYTQGEDTVIKFTYWPEETEKEPATGIPSINITTGKGISWGRGEDLAWGAYENTATKAIVGEGITGLNGGVFMTFAKLKTIEITDDLVKVDGPAFEGCSALTSIYYAGNTPVEGEADLSAIKNLKAYAMDGCKKITSVKLSPDYTGSIYQELFKANAFETIEIPAGTVSINSEAFALCENLKTVVVKGMETTIDANAFKNFEKNPETGVFDVVKGDNTENVTVYGLEGSAVQANCLEYGIKFALIGTEPAPAETYTVTYDANGGENAPAAQTKTENVALTLATAVPTRTGYTFKGWATAVDGEVAYAAGASYTENADVTLYAVWEEKVADDNIQTGNNTSKYSNNLWEFNKTTKVLTVKSNTTGYNETGNVNDNDSWKSFITEIEEVVLIGNMSKISGHAFNGAVNLKKVTTPAIAQIDGYAFAGCKNLETVCITGHIEIDGVLDFSTVKGANTKGSSSFSKSDVFTTSTKSTAIILGSAYSDVIAEDQTEAPTLDKGNLPDNIKTIYGSTEYLKAFCEANDLEFVPFGKAAGNKIAWTIEDGTLTLMGEGELTDLGTAITAYAADVTKVVIPDTITSIADGAFAALTALESATFKGDAPAVADGAKPFGEQSADFYITVNDGAEGFEGDTWCGYTLNKLTYIAGDLNDDGAVGIDDAVLLAQYLADWQVDVNVQAADTNGDGSVGIDDAVLLAQYLADWEVDLVGPSAPSTPDTPDPEAPSVYGDNEVDFEKVNKDADAE